MSMVDEATVTVEGRENVSEAQNFLRNGGTLLVPEYPHTGGFDAAFGFRAIENLVPRDEHGNLEMWRVLWVVSGKYEPKKTRVKGVPGVGPKGIFNRVLHSLAKVEGLTPRQVYYFYQPTVIDTLSGARRREAIAKTSSERRRLIDQASAGGYIIWYFPEATRVLGQGHLRRFVEVARKIMVGLERELGENYVRSMSVITDGVQEVMPEDDLTKVDPRVPLLLQYMPLVSLEQLTIIAADTKILVDGCWVDCSVTDAIAIHDRKHGGRMSTRVPGENPWYPYD